MAVARAARWPGRLALLLLAAVLIAIGVSVSPHTVVPAPTDSKDASVEHSVVVNAVPPGRVTGRPAAEPSLLKIHSQAELLLFGALPSSGPAPELMRLGAQEAGITQVSNAAQLPAAGDRAPPVQQADL